MPISKHILFAPFVCMLKSWNSVCIVPTGVTGFFVCKSDSPLIVICQPRAGCKWFSNPLLTLCLFMYLQEEFRLHFKNISRIMDCVGCSKCRLWGKLQVRHTSSHTCMHTRDMYKHEMCCLLSFIFVFIKMALLYK